MILLETVIIDVQSNNCIYSLWNINVPSPFVCSPLRQLGSCSHVSIDASINNSDIPFVGKSASVVACSDVPGRLSDMLGQLYENSGLCGNQIHLLWRVDGFRSCEFEFIPVFASLLVYKNGVHFDQRFGEQRRPHILLVDFVPHLLCYICPRVCPSLNSLHSYYL